MYNFFKCRKWLVWAYGGGSILIGSVFAQVYMSVLLNKWYRSFYDILQDAVNRELFEFYHSIYGFFQIALPYVLLATVTNYFTRLYAFAWRESMTEFYLPRWGDDYIEGASQRIQQDTERFARIVDTIGLQIVRAVMTLVAFIPILYHLSKYVIVEPLSNYEGSLMWVAVILSMGGLAISWYVGKYLKGLEYNNQVVEAKFRKELVFGEDKDKDYFRKDVPTLFELFTGVKFNYRRLFLHYGYFDLWVNLFDQCSMIVPYLVIAPGLFNGLITLGIMTQVSNAFQKVHGGFTLFIHQWPTINELRSIRMRLKEFETKLIK